MPNYWKEDQGVLLDELGTRALVRSYQLAAAGISALNVAPVTDGAAIALAAAAAANTAATAPAATAAEFKKRLGLP